MIFTNNITIQYAVNTERMNALSMPKSLAYIKHIPDR